MIKIKLDASGGGLFPNINISKCQDVEYPDFYRSFMDMQYGLRLYRIRNTHTAQTYMACYSSTTSPGYYSDIVYPYINIV